MFEDPALAGKWDACPPALQEIIAEFQEAPAADRIEYMVDFAESLPDLPARLQGQREQMEQVHECQSPIFLYTELDGDELHFFFDIPHEAPTVRGYASLLAEGLAGATPAQVLALPNDLYQLLGLNEIISHLRLRGLHSLLLTMKRQTAAVAQLADAAAE